MVGQPPEVCWTVCPVAKCVCVGGVPCCQRAHVTGWGGVKRDGYESYVDSGVEGNVVQSNAM
jgi:hypothetical protein